MDRDRLRREITALSQKYHVAVNDELQGYELQDFNYPEGWVLRNRDRWTRRDGVPDQPAHVAPLLLRIPDSYPWSQPYTYLPRDLQYTKGPVEHFINTPYDDWVVWCVHDIDWNPQNRTSNLAKYLQFMQMSFSHPDKANPLRFASNP